MIDTTVKLADTFFLSSKFKFGIATMSRGKKVAVSISTWFRVPEEGMTEFEILCRASAFLVRSKNPKYPAKFHLLTASHVVAPWRFPKYYPDEWLRYVNQNHTQYTLEIRDDHGVMLGTASILGNTLHHCTRDLAVLHLEDEASADQIFATHGIEFQSMSQRELVEGEVLEFHGHDVEMPSSISNDDKSTGQPASSMTEPPLSGTGESVESNSNSLVDDTSHGRKEVSDSATDENKAVSGDSEGSEDTREPKPLTVYGHFVLSTAKQFFALTKPVLTYGMCGGAVIARSSSSITANGVMKTTTANTVCGMLEGIVPLDSPSEQHRGMAAFIDSATLTE